MIRIARTNSDNPDFLHLVEMLDEHLARVDGEDHPYYARLNATDIPRNVVLAYSNGGAVGCGAIRPFPDGMMEVKRMYVLPAWRRKGIAGLILAELEEWAKELGAGTCVLETGKKQPEAVALYGRHGYRQITNYGPFIDVENSICFQKLLP
jgi:GNAT superfamily N-acetyltransferase